MTKSHYNVPQENWVDLKKKIFLKSAFCDITTVTMGGIL